MAKKEAKPIKEARYCPYCDSEIAEASFPYCEACEVEVFTCPSCKKPMPRNKQVCPSCGANVREACGRG